MYRLRRSLVLVTFNNFSFFNVMEYDSDDWDNLSAITFFFVIVISSIGWIMNFMSVISRLDEEITMRLILATTGIFVFPLGAVLGWIGI